MKIRLILAIVVLVSITAVAILFPKQSCNGSDVSCDTSANITPKADLVTAEIARGTAILIDVRESGEFAASRASGAKNIPLGDIEANTFGKLDKDMKLYVYCQSGRRAQLAKAALEKQDYTKVESLGGLSDWQSMGGKISQ